MGRWIAVAAEGEPGALPKRPVSGQRASPGWGLKALTELTAQGWHLVREGGTGLVDPSGRPRQGG